MSTYNGRRGPNVSQFLRNLTALSPQGPVEEENYPEDINLFTNTEFFDLDSAQNTDYRAQPVKIDTAAPTPAVSTTDEPLSSSSVVGDISSSIEFISGDYPFNDSSAYPAAPLSFFGEEPHPSFQSLQPNHNHSHNHVYPNQVASQQQQQQQQQQSLPHFSQQQANYSRATAEKRKSDDLNPANTPMSLDESARAAAEEDKRRRNTAASARFRIKKKQREQALEKSAKDMTEKVASLESKVSQLETENKWLKNLLTDKNGGSEEINILWKEFTKHASQRQAKSDSATKADR